MGSGEPWNSWELQPPPYCTVKTPANFSDIKDMKNTAFGAITVLKQTDILHKEAAILSRYLYKYKRIFRHDKGLQNLVKINQGLHRYLKLNFYKTMSEFKSTLPLKIHEGLSHVYLPTRQMLKWLLLRIIAFSKIFLRIMDVSKEAGKYLYAKLCLGWSLNYTNFALALCSRILVCAKFLLANAIEWYNSFRIHLPMLTETVEYLPEFRFPQKLQECIGDIDLRPPAKKTDIDKIFELIDLTGVNDSSSDFDDEVLITDEIFVDTIDSNDGNSSDDCEIIMNEPKTSIMRQYTNGDYDDDDDDDIDVDDDDDDMMVVFEKTVPKRKPPPTSVPKVRMSEDLGKPIVKQHKFEKKKKNNYGQRWKQMK